MKKPQWINQKMQGERDVNEEKWKENAPIKAMMESKAGKTIDITRKINTVTTRMTIFIIPRNQADRPTMADELSEMAC